MGDRAMISRLVLLLAMIALDEPLPMILKIDGTAIIRCNGLDIVYANGQGKEYNCKSSDIIFKGGFER